MTDDIVTRLRALVPLPLGFADESAPAHLISEAADEIERLRSLMKAFIYQWEQEEIGKGNGTDYFNAVHATRKAVRGE
jgi:hypothetical protein